MYYTLRKGTFKPLRVYPNWKPPVVCLWASLSNNPHTWVWSLGPRGINPQAQRRWPCRKGPGTQKAAQSPERGVLVLGKATVCSPRDPLPCMCEPGLPGTQTSPSCLFRALRTHMGS